MNLQKLKKTTEFVIKANSSRNIVGLFQALESNFIQSIQNPSESQAAQYTASYEKLKRALEQQDLNKLSLSQMKILKKFSGEFLVGEGLIKNIEDISYGNSNPAETKKRFSELKKELADFYKHMNQLHSSLESLYPWDFKGSEEVEDEIELEFLLPENIYEENLNDLTDQLDKFSDHLLVLREISTGSREPLHVNGVSSGSVEIFISLDIDTANNIMQLLASITNLIAAIIILRKHNSAIEKQDAPIEIIKELRKWEESKATEEIQKMKTELLANAQIDDVRRKELDSATDKAIKFFTSIIDKGARMDVSIPEIPFEEDARKKTKEVKALETIQKNKLEVRSLSHKQKKSVLQLTFDKNTCKKNVEKKNK